MSYGGARQNHDDDRSWTYTTKDMRVDYMPPKQSEKAATQDPHRLVQCQVHPEFLWVQHHSDTFHSHGDNLHWQGVVAKLSSFGFAVAVHPRQPDTARLVPVTKDECHTPGDARFMVTRTCDGGRSFETLEHDLPDGPAYSLVYRHGLDVDPSGERLVMGSTTGGLWPSESGGKGWQQLFTNLLPVYRVRFV